MWILGNQTIVVVFAEGKEKDKLIVKGKLISE
jgi:hypothetical protein